MPALRTTPPEEPPASIWSKKPPLKRGGGRAERGRWGLEPLSQESEILASSPLEGSLWAYGSRLCIARPTPSGTHWYYDNRPAVHELEPGAAGFSLISQKSEIFASFPQGKLLRCMEVDSVLQERNRAGPKDVEIRLAPCTNWFPALPGGRSMIAPTDSNEVRKRNDTEQAQRM